MHLIYEHMMFNMLNNMICGKHIFAKDICMQLQEKKMLILPLKMVSINSLHVLAHLLYACDEYVFESKSILIAGNGEFNVKHYDENLTHIKELMYCLQNLNYMDYCISQAYTE